ncbi:YncE family protein [Geobacillus sp. CCR]
MPLIDIREHGGQFGGGMRLKNDNTILNIVKSTSYNFFYGGYRAAYNDEADGLIFIAFNNSTGGDYHVECFDRNLNKKFQTPSFADSIESVARDDTHFYVSSRPSTLWKFPIVSSGIPTQVWTFTIPNNQVYPAMQVRNGKVYGINNYLLRIEVINSSGQLENTIPITASATLMEMDKDGYLYVYDLNRELYKIDPVTKQKLWTVTGLTVNGSNPSFLKQSENYIFAITTANQITKVDKQTGAVIGTKNFSTTANRIGFDRFGNSFIYYSGQSGVTFTGKENHQVSIYVQTNITLENLYGVKKPFSVGSMIQVLDFYYALRG